MANPNVMYSIQTYCAYCINKDFYNNIHYVWCAPYFDSPYLASSSNPRDIYNDLIKDVFIRDYHAHRYVVMEKIPGLEQGVDVKYSSGIITATQKDEILGMIKTALLKKDYYFFHPVIYVIPYSNVRSRAERVPSSNTALPFSQEYLIKDLHTDEFDLIDLEGGGSREKNWRL